jgi:hypothetical protein
LPKNKNKNKNNLFLFLFFSSVRRGGGRGGEGGNKCVRADASVLPPGNFITDATVRPSHGRPSGHRPIVRPSVRYRPRDNPGVTQWQGRVQNGGGAGNEGGEAGFAMGGLQMRGHG